MGIAGLEKYNVGQIRTVLKHHGLSDEKVASVKGKSNLVYELSLIGDEQSKTPLMLVEEYYGGDGNDELEDLADVDFEEAVYEEPELGYTEQPEVVEQEVFTLQHSTEYVEEVTRPIYGSQEWSDWVMTFFQDNELENGNPTINGLRRVSQLVLGPIINSMPVSLHSSLPEDPMLAGRAYCSYQITFLVYPDTPMWISEGELGKMQTRTFGGAGGAYLGNTDDDFAIFPEAMAETRAETRALRKALLINTVSHDELTSKDPTISTNYSVQKNVFTPAFDPETSWNDEDKIQDNQKAHIEHKCKQLNIDTHKFINLAYYEGRSDELAFNSIDEITRGKASEMIKQLTRYQSEAGDESRSIPESILLEN